MDKLLIALQHTHILVWWIILFSGLWANYRVWRGYLRVTPWTAKDRIAGLVFSTALATQLLIGIALYFNSPEVKNFFAGGANGPGAGTAVFFGMMHPATMIMAVVLGQVGYSVSKRLDGDRRKFQTATRCYTTALAFVLMAVPWPFLPYGRSLMP